MKTKKKKKSGKIVTIALIAIFVIGLSLLLYPTLSDYWNSFHSSQAITSYAKDVAGMSKEVYDKVWGDAQKYNADLLKRTNAFSLSEEMRPVYEAQLNHSADGIMGSVEIPGIEVTLPIYHGTSEAVLQHAVGHVEWTSLPVGGESTHCVLSGHRGLPSAKLFTNLDQLSVGDIFLLHVMDETLTYEVDQILIVEPDDCSALQITPGMDYCTLVTCTPYGINTHRLLVRGHRITTAEAAPVVHITADAVQVETILVAAGAAIPLLLLLFLFSLLWNGIKKRING